MGLRGSAEHDTDAPGPVSDGRMVSAAGRLPAHTKQGKFMTLWCMLLQGHARPGPVINGRTNLAKGAPEDLQFAWGRRWLR